MRIGSLFSGIGGLELGLERAGLGETVWQVESDPFCRSILEKHWPDAERFEDVKEVGSNTLAPVDLICGGFPCQDISTAGKRAGISGRRSGLWTEYARIIREIRPRFVVVENVAALLFRGLGDVLGDLAACGYDAVWDCVPAQAVGAPHQRDRLFVVAYPEKLFRDGGQDNRERRTKGPGKTQDISKPRNCFSRSLPRIRGWAPEHGMDRVAYGVSDGIHTARLRALGNAVVPQCAEVIGHIIQELAP